jgi:hypothetical protein
VYAIDVPEMPGEEFKIVAEHCRIMSRDLKYISASVTDDKEINDVMEFIVGDSGTGTLDICVAVSRRAMAHAALPAACSLLALLRPPVFSARTTPSSTPSRTSRRSSTSTPPACS